MYWGKQSVTKIAKSDYVKDFCLLKCLFWEVEGCTKYLCKFVGVVKIVNICVIICINNTPFLFSYEFSLTCCKQVSPASERRVLEQQAYMLFYVRDRRNIVPRKPPTDVAQKENLKANANGNRTSSTFNHVLKEAVQNGPVEKRLSSATPAAVTRKDASNVVPSTVPIMKEVSLQKDNCLIKTECVVLKKDSVSENFSKVPLSNNPPDGLPVSKPKSIEALSQPSPSCNGDVPNFENTPKGKINDYNEKGKSKNDSSVSVATSPNFNDVQSSSTAKNVTDETSQKVRQCFLHMLPRFSFLLVGFSPCFILTYKSFYLAD